MNHFVGEEQRLERAARLMILEELDTYKVPGSMVTLVRYESCGEEALAIKQKVLSTRWEYEGHTFLRCT